VLLLNFLPKTLPVVLPSINRRPQIRAAYFQRQDFQFWLILSGKIIRLYLFLTPWTIFVDVKYFVHSGVKSVGFENQLLFRLPQKLLCAPSGLRLDNNFTIQTVFVRPDIFPSSGNSIPERFVKLRINFEQFLKWWVPRLMPQ
jgi:hypothetical protein